MKSKSKSTSSTTTTKAKSPRRRSLEKLNAINPPPPAYYLRTEPEKDQAIKKVLELIADGYTTAEIAELAGIERQTIAKWIASDTRGVGCSYAHAREARADRIAREVFEIADKSDGESPAAVNKARLQCDVRKWYLSKILPEKYGDHIELTGKNGGPLSVAAIGAVGIADIRQLRDMIFGSIDGEKTGLQNGDNA